MGNYSLINSKWQSGDTFYSVTADGYVQEHVIIQPGKAPGCWVVEKVEEQNPDSFGPVSSVWLEEDLLDRDTAVALAKQRINDCIESYRNRIKKLIERLNAL